MTAFYRTSYTSPVGNLILAADDKENLTGLYIEGQKYFRETIFSETTENNNLLIFKKAKNWLDEYFEGKNPNIKSLSLSPKGSEFRQSVWKILTKIPYGKVYTYKDIANIVAKEKGVKKMSAQAIGGAVGHNPISIIIPCHRVIGSNNSLVGYAGGIDKKIKLLTHENVDISNFSIPK